MYDDSVAGLPEYYSWDCTLAKIENGPCTGKEVAVGGNGLLFKNDIARIGGEFLATPDLSRPPLNSAKNSNLLWWAIPGVLAGMPMPFIHPERRMAGGGSVKAFDD